jgi:integrase
MLTCDELARTWADRWPRPDPETNRHNRRMVRAFGADFAGRNPEKIDVAEARAWATANPGKGRYVRAMLNDALDDRLIDSHPFANLRIPQPEEEPITVPTEEQIEKLEIAAGEVSCDLLHAIVVAKRTGLRQGELRALAVEDVDVVAKRLDVEWQITRDGRLKRPKKGSTGRILLPPDAGAMLAARERSAIAETPLRPYRLFNLSRDQLQRQWKAARVAAGIWIRWHDLRHYCATWMLDAGGTVEDVARQLRCDEELVRRRYGHPDREKALARLEGLVG